MNQDSIPTHIDSMESSVSLEKGSGFVRRGVEDSARNFRQEVEREYRAEIRQLREERVQQERLINELRAEVVELQHWKIEISQPIEAATVIVNAGIVVKYLIIAIIGLTSAIGGISAMIGAINAWFSK